MCRSPVKSTVTCFSFVLISFLGVVDNFLYAEADLLS